VALPAFAAVCHAAARCCKLPAVQRLINISYRLGPQQQTRHSGVWQLYAKTHRDKWMPDCYIDPAPHIMQAVLKWK